MLFQAGKRKPLKYYVACSLKQSSEKISSFLSTKMQRVIVKSANYSNQPCLVFSWHYQPHETRLVVYIVQISYHFSNLNHKLAAQSLWQALSIVICIQSVNDWQLSIEPITEGSSFMYNASWGLKSYSVQAHGRLKNSKICKGFQRKGKKTNNEITIISGNLRKGWL